MKNNALMGSRMKSLVLLCSMILAFANLSEGATNVVALTVFDNEKTVPVKLGQPVTITLKGNPTTGYLWAVAGLSSNTVEQVGEVEYQRSPAGKGMVGVGGVFVATFKAVKPGKTMVRMEYRRPWEKDTPPAETFAVTLDVK